MRSRLLIIQILFLFIFMAGMTFGFTGCMDLGCGSDDSTDTGQIDDGTATDDQQTDTQTDSGTGSDTADDDGTATDTTGDDDSSSDTATDDTSEEFLDPNREQAPYPPLRPDESCGSWVLVDNVCTGRFCSDIPKSESCPAPGDKDYDKCGECIVIDSKAAMSGAWPEVHEVSEGEPWHYSRSTHFGLTSAGACGFGLYGLCTTKFNFTDPTLAKTCADFCDAYPDLCADPENISLRGNFAAPQGNYYTQFWPTLPGERDNYLSCGECFEVVRTKKDGTEYQPGESGYTKPVAVQIVDSCPCNANVKWCCGSGRDNCDGDNEELGYKYTCPTPPGDLDPHRDPSPEESIHLDLSDIAMGRLNGLEPGVIPIKYRRIPCPVVGNIYVRLLNGSGYYLSLNVINVAGLGSVVKVEAQTFSGEWVALTRSREDLYSSSRPQERYGAWREPDPKVLPPGPSDNEGPFQLPLSLRITDPSGRVLVAKDAIPKPEGYEKYNDPTNKEYYHGDWKPLFTSGEWAYFDTGVQF